MDGNKKKEIENHFIKDFYLAQIPDQGYVDLDLSMVVGIGGESIILKVFQEIDDPEIPPGAKIAVKASPFETGIGDGISYIDAKLSTQSHQIPELTPARFQHQHIIKYYRNIFRKAGTLFHLSGRLLDISILDQNFEV